VALALPLGLLLAELLELDDAVAVDVLAEVPSPVGTELCVAVMDRDPLDVYVWLELAVATEEYVADAVGTDDCELLPVALPDCELVALACRWG
jgi:hypothetical protein